MHGSLGYIKVPVPGVPIQAVGSSPYLNKPQPCHAVMFEVLPDNTGRVYIGLKGMNKTTGVDVVAILAIPTDNVAATFSAALTVAPNALLLNQYYVDADVANEGVLATFLIL